MIGFYCATPYHVMVALNLLCTTHVGEEANLFLLNHFTDAADLVEKLGATGRFRRVELIDMTFKTTRGNLERLAGAFFPKQAVKAIWQQPYDCFIFFSNDFLTISQIVRSCRRMNANCHFAYAEDGIGSYIRDMYTPNRKIACLLRLNGGFRYTSSIQDLMVFDPQLVRVGHGLSLHEIPRIDRSNHVLMDLYASVWPEAVGVSPVTYLQQPYLEDFRIKVEAVERDTISALTQAFPGQVGIKLHPRTDTFLASEPAIQSRSSVPFELLLLKQDIDNLLLVTICSTAALTPYLLFGARPVVILTYKLFEDLYGSRPSDISGYYEQIIHQYNRTEERLFIPETIAGYHRLIEQLSARRVEEKHIEG